MRWRLMDTPPAPGAFNMALDAALMESVRGGADPVLRFYRWSPACLSLGRNQPAAGLYDQTAIRARGLDVVRRPTGGRAVLHDRELTYSVVMPEGSLGSPRTAYATINRALVRGLGHLGVGAALQPGGGARAVAPSVAPCFRDPTEGEVVVAGGKLVGSAQYREAGVVLQHGSLLLEDDQSTVPELLVDTPEIPVEPAGTLSDHLPRIPDWADLVAALVAGWVEVIGGSIVRCDPDPAEARRAERLTSHYSGVDWTWRR